MIPLIWLHIEEIEAAEKTVTGAPSQTHLFRISGTQALNLQFYKPPQVILMMLSLVWWLQSYIKLHSSSRTTKAGWDWTDIFNPDSGAAETLRGTLRVGGDRANLVTFLLCRVQRRDASSGCSAWSSWPPLKSKSLSHTWAFSKLERETCFVCKWNPSAINSNLIKRVVQRL